MMMIKVVNVISDTTGFESQLDLFKINEKL
jgi:hypothetical protein